MCASVGADGQWVLGKRAEAGQLDPNGMTTALRYSADHWKAFQDARDGRKPE